MSESNGADDRLVIDVNMNAKCPRCGRPGATGADGKGICLDCLSKQMLTAEGRTGPVEDEWQRRPDVEVIVEYCVQRWHPHLQRASVVGLGRPKATKVNGKERWADIKVSTGRERVLYDGRGRGIDYILTVALDVWLKIPKRQKIALIDHEHCHAGGYDSDREAWYLLPHDLEEFRAIVERHGAWREDVRLFIETAQRVVLPQMTFDEMQRGAPVTP